MTNRIHENETPLTFSESKSKTLANEPSCAQLEALKEAIFNVSLINEHKLQQVKEKVSLGEYHIQSQSLASKLLEYSIPKEVCEMA